MARTSATVTDSELQAVQAWAERNDIIWDSSADTQKEAEENGKLLKANFIEGNWLCDITEQSLDEHLELLRPYLKFYDANQKMTRTAWKKMSQEEQQVITDFWATPRRIEHSSYNNALILGWLTGHNLKVTHVNIAQAVDKLVDKLTWVTTSTFQSPIPQATKDAHTKPGSFISDANKTPAQYKKENDEALAKARGEKTSAEAKEVNAAEVQANSLKGNSHSETEAIQAVYCAYNGVPDWRNILKMRLAKQAEFNKARQVRTYINPKKTF